MVVEPVVVVIVLPSVVTTPVRAEVVMAEEEALALPVVVAELAPVAVSVLAVERTERAEPPMVVWPLERAADCG